MVPFGLWKLVYSLAILCCNSTNLTVMPKSSPINMRVEPEQHALLTRAAAALNMDRSTFILSVACKEAESVLLDQRYFHLSDEQFEEFEKVLSQPLNYNEKLKNLISSPAPWE